MEFLCSNCSAKLKYKDFEKHKEECGIFDCPIDGCGKTGIIKQNLLEHWKKECRCVDWVCQTCLIVMNWGMTYNHNCTL